MRQRRSIIFFWILILIPTLFMATAAFQLLSHEQERINLSARNALIERGEAVSQTIHFTIEAVKANLIRSLEQIDKKALKKTLLGWEETNPLVRNVFIYHRQTGLEYPVRGMASTAEERGFITRYESLFSGKVSFEVMETNETSDSPVPFRTDALTADKKKVPAREQLVYLSKAVPNMPAEQDGEAVEAAPQKAMESKMSGWLPWFSENNLCVLIWVKEPKDDLVYGMELELMTMLSRLVVDFPRIDDALSAVILTDGNSRVIHQSGQLQIEGDQDPVSQIAVSDLLPHWMIEIYIDDQGHGAANGFLYLSLVLVAIFITAIVSGGIMLTRMTLKNMKDAVQKTSFVSSVSHELKTPLTSIRMYAELLLSGRVKNAEKTTKYLSVIVAESERLSRLINNVLDFGKLEQGKKMYQMARFELDAFLYELISAHTIRMKAQPFEIITQITPGSYELVSDRDALEQVVLNLIDNALKYAGNGRFIKFILDKDKDSFVLRIIDDGPGIPKALRDAIFEKFYRMDDSLTATQPGSGLGLSIARQILRDLGGDLYVEEQEETGSCFTVRIKNHESD